MSIQGSDQVTHGTNPAYTTREFIKPVGPVAIMAPQLPLELSDKINYELSLRRAEAVQEDPRLADQRGFFRKDYRTEVDLDRFSSGEGRATLIDSVRGHDLFIIADVLNYGKYTTRMRRFVSKSPDDHYQDVVRMIAATHGLCTRVNVIMPYLYEGRRYRRMNRGSMDCALMLKQLFGMGITNFITFDAHDARVANAVPRQNFETFPTSLHIIESLLTEYPDIDLSGDKFMVVSPDENTVNRCIFYASMLRSPLGIFYRKRDNPMEFATSADKIQKEYLGDSVKGKDCLIIDDMLDTGRTVLDCAIQLKERGARRIFVGVSFAHFSDGYAQMNGAKNEGVIEKIFATNLTFHSPELLAKSWFQEVDLSEYIALIIDALNYNVSLANVINPSERIRKVVEQHMKGNGAK